MGDGVREVVARGRGGESVLMFFWGGGSHRLLRLKLIVWLWRHPARVRLNRRFVLSPTLVYSPARKKECKRMKTNYG